LSKSDDTHQPTDVKRIYICRWR